MTLQSNSTPSHEALQNKDLKGSRPGKIAIVANSTWNIYNFRLPLIKRLTSMGFEVVVIAPVDEYIHYLSKSHFTKHIPLRNLQPHRRNPVRDLMLTWELYRIFQREKPDLVVQFTIKPNIFGSLAARMARVPSISTITGLGYTFLNRRLVDRIIPWLYSLALSNARKVIFYNPDDYQFFRDQRYIPAHKGKIVSGSGINTNYFRPLPTPQQGGFVFLFIGRLLYDKGLREFVEAGQQFRKKYPDARIWVVGEFNPNNPASVAKEQLVEWIDSQQIRYFGHVKDVRPFIKRADVVVLPSYREGVPRSLLEGMAMGKPIIATNAAGCRETVEEGRNGYLVEPRDAESLAQAMEAIYRLPDAQRELMGERSRDLTHQRFDEKKIAGEFVDLILAELDQEVSAKEWKSSMASGPSDS